MAFSIQPLPDTTFGAVVTEIGLVDLDTATFQQLYDAWLEYALLIFPGQQLSKSEQVEFAKRFGSIELLGGQELVELSNLKADGTLRGDDDMVKILRGNMHWHADSTYMEVQAKGAVFSARVVPQRAGETGWADMRAAFDALDPQTRVKVEELTALHSLHYSQSKVGHVHSDDSDYIGYGLEHEGVPIRPLTKRHPETGRTSLLIGRHAYGLANTGPAESEAFLAGLVEQACQPPRTYHHSWRPGDVVVWDNRCLLHRGRPWEMSIPRVMWHSRIAGDPVTESAELVGAPAG